MSNVTLKAVGDTHPLDWKTPIYTQFGMIGASIVIFFFLPESPCKWDAIRRADIRVACRQK